MSRRRRLVAVVGVATALLAVLTSCVSVPTEGPVQFESMGTTEHGEASVPVLVTGPSPGDSPLQVARGFLDSMASYEAGQPVTREYLDPAIAERWQPTEVLVYSSGGLPLSEPSPGKVVLDVSKLAEVSVNGAWTPAPAGERITLDLHMTRVDGEWRVGQPPNALVMSEYNFRREYSQYDLYFFDPEYQVLVPDPVYLPNRGPVETLLVSALLRGPSAWLRPAVQPALPENVRLSAPSVTVDGGTATVDLDRRVLALYQQQRRYLVTQLVWTLRQLSGVTAVKVTVDRVPLAPLAGKEVIDLRSDEGSWALYDPAVPRGTQGAYALSGGRVVVIGPEEVVPVSGPLGEGPLQARSLAVGFSRERAAVTPRDPETEGTADWLATVSDDGTTVRIHDSAGNTRTLYTGEDILEPSWDRTGWLWLVDRQDGRATILVADVQDRLHEVAAPGLVGADVRALKVSRDGARVAALVQHKNRTALVVGRVERRDTIAISGVRELPVDLTTMADLAWSAPDQVAVVGESDDAGSARPAVVSVDGSQIDFLSSGPPSLTISAAPDQPTLLGAKDGRVYVEEDGYRWEDVVVGTSPAYPG